MATGIVHKRWVVVVTYGTIPNSPYACVPSIESARSLLRKAKKLGYRNGKIMTLPEYHRIKRASEDHETNGNHSQIHSVVPH